MATINQLATMSDTVADGDLLALRDVSVSGNNKDVGLTITKLRADAFLGRANTWTAAQTFSSTVLATSRFALGDSNRNFTNTGGGTARSDSEALFRLTVNAIFSAIVRVEFCEAWSGTAANQRAYAGYFIIGKNGTVTAQVARTTIANANIRIGTSASGNNIDFILTNTSDAQIATQGTTHAWRVEVLAHTGTWTYTPYP